MATREQVKSIIRRATRSDKLNILVIGSTHERYEQALCKTGHEFYSIKHGKEWDRDCGEIPSNYHVLDFIPYDLDFDIVLTHTSDDRVDIANDIGYRFGIPVIRHTHTLPQSEGEAAFHHSRRVDLDTFISDYSMKAWGYGNTGKYINHGIDTEFWNTQGNKTEHVCLSVVNLWAQRDWACGWNLWNSIKPGLPVKVLGNNPGLSKPAPTLKALRDEYSKSLIFLNTSLHSPVPMSLLEAMSCGCAIVSTDNCMISEIIKDDENGFLFDTPEEANAICKELLAKPDVAVEYGTRARQTILSKFGIENFINNWNSVFKDVLYK